MTQSERQEISQMRRYRNYVASLTAEEFENERYTVENEWQFAQSDYLRRYPALEREDLLSVLR